MFLEQSDLGDGHAPVDGLHHVVNREQAHLNGGEGLHFDTSLSSQANRRGAPHGGLLWQAFQFNRHLGEGEWVAEGNQVAGAFGRLNGRDAGNPKYIALLGGTPLDDRKRLRLHLNQAAGRGRSCRVRLR